MKGKLYGLGIGPGDPELLTLKAYRLLRSVAVVCVPKSKQENASVALDIVRPHLLEGQKVIEVVMPMHRDRQLLQEYWRQAARQVLVHLHQGQNVAFLTLGDPLFYSTYAYLMRAVVELDPGIQAETVPGITSINAAAARLNLPLAEGAEGLAVLPHLEDMAELDTVLKTFPNVVLMKAARYSEEIVKYLEDHGLTECATLVSRCGQKDEQVVRDVRILKDTPVDYFSLMLIRQGGES